MEDATKKSKSFEGFTNLYEFSKTLQFGLIPLKWDDDRKMIAEDGDFSVLRKHGILEEDERIGRNIKVAKFYLDILHRELIDKALGGLTFEKEDLKNYARILDEIEQNGKSKNDEKKEIGKKLKKELAIAKDNLLKKIGMVFEENGTDILLSKSCLEKLQTRFTQEEIEKLRRENKDIGVEYPDITYIKTDRKVRIAIDAGYLDDFHKNREQLYSVKGKKNSLGRRILDNFEIFYKNKKIYEKYKKLDIDFSEVEKNFSIRLEAVFDFDHYKKYLTQSGIDEYAKIFSGQSKKQERGINIHGLNQIINLYIQKKQNGHKEKQKEKSKKKTKFNKKDYPTFIRLKKQILSQIFRKEIVIESDQDLIRELRFFIEKSKEKVAKAKALLEFFSSYEKNDIDLNKVYLSKSKINSFALKVFKEPNDFISVFRDGASNSDLIDFGRIKTRFEDSELKYRDFFKKFIKEKSDFESFLLLLKQEVDLLIDGGETVVRGGERETIASLDKKEKSLEEKLRWFEDKVEKDKKMKDEEEGEFCSAVLAYSKTVSDITKRAEVFWLNEKQNAKIGEDNKDMTFYGKFDKFADDDFVPFLYFDKFGNYLKKRSRNTAREIKLHFGNDHLLDGWDMNKEPDYHGFLLRNGNEYYLGIGNKKGDLFHTKSGKSVKKVDEAYAVSNDKFYEKIEYKQLDIGKFEGIAFGKGNDTKTSEKLQKKKRELATEFLEGDIEQLESLMLVKKEYDDFKQARQENKDWDRKFPKEKMSKLIDYYITCLGKRDDWKRFDLKFRKPEEYADREDFITDIQRQAYWIDPQKVSKDYVDEKVKNHELFLFKIHNKDFYDFEQKSNDKKNHTVNLFTQYFLELFTPENIGIIKSKDTNKAIFELDGKAEIRFRQKTDDVKLKIYQKDGENVTYVDKRDGSKEKEVIQHRRFAKDALTLHLKTRLNFGKHIDLFNFNKRVNTQLLTQVPVRILGMDRGENNLIYYCFLDERGEIEGGKCGSLNKVGERIRELVNGKKAKEPVDYFQLLVDREGQRDLEQKNWQKMTPIKDLKKAYLGNVVNWITEEIFSGLDNSIATFNVLEDLSDNFKRTRFFRERQVYQGFERALINKLSYLVYKKRGNFRDAYQFTPIVDSVEKMEKSKQLGTVIYVPASYTSKICPAPKCGWRKKLYVKSSASKEEIVSLLKLGLEFFNNELETKPGAIQILFEKEGDRFCFRYKREQEYSNDGKKGKYADSNKVFSNVSRMKWDAESRKITEFLDGTPESITNQLKELLGEEGIKLENINRQLVDRQQELSLEFFQSIIFYFNLIMQIRNYDKQKRDDATDYIQCPECLFDTRRSTMNGKLSMIKNGDANGAYNIARKGLIQLRKIRECPDGPGIVNNKEWDEAVSDWDAFVQNQWNPTSKSQR